jgi:site-specific recombinase XerD
MNSIGSAVFAFFEDHLKVQKGLRPASIKSYRDTIKLFLAWVAKVNRRPLTKLVLADLSSDQVLEFLHAIEVERHNQIQTRNQRLAALRTFYRYLAIHCPEMLAEAQRVEAIPVKRTNVPETLYLERDEIDSLFRSLAQQGAPALRDRAILLLLYNTGARAQEIVDLRVGDVDLENPLRVRLHGKGDKWRSCPLWPETVALLKQLGTVQRADPLQPLFVSRTGRPLTRFGLYKLVKRHTAALCPSMDATRKHNVTPHVFRHTTAVHLLEAGVDVNVIRGWLGHVSIETTQRYAEINLRTKQAALAVCTPPTDTEAASPTKIRWRQDVDLMKWLQSL